MMLDFIVLRPSGSLTQPGSHENESPKLRSLQTRFLMWLFVAANVQRLVWFFSIHVCFLLRFMELLNQSNVHSLVGKLGCFRFDDNGLFIHGLLQMTWLPPEHRVFGSPFLTSWRRKRLWNVQIRKESQSHLTDAERTLAVSVATDLLVLGR